MGACVITLRDGVRPRDMRSGEKLDGQVIRGKVAPRICRMFADLQIAASRAIVPSLCWIAPARTPNATHMIPHPINNTHSNPIPADFRSRRIIPHHDLRSTTFTSSPLTPGRLTSFPAPAAPARIGIRDDVRRLFPLFSFGSCGGVACVARGV